LRVATNALEFRAGGLNDRLAPSTHEVADIRQELVGRCSVSTGCEIWLLIFLRKGTPRYSSLCAGR
jgi:hypothetical protein